MYTTTPQHHKAHWNDEVIKLPKLMDRDEMLGLTGEKALLCALNEKMNWSWIVATDRIWFTPAAVDVL